MNQTTGKIYLAEQRRISESTQFIRFSTLNFGDFFQEHKQPVGSLYLVNEEILAGSQSLYTQVEQDSHFVIIPLVGDVQFYINEDNSSKIEVCEVQVITAPANTFIRVANPFANNTIHFLQLALKTEPHVKVINTQLFKFKMKDLENQLASIIPKEPECKGLSGLPFSINLGRLEGRREINFLLQQQKSICFIFVLAGAFEAQGRLLHEKDGLALWDTEEVEIEALSNNALILIMELNPADNLL